MTSISKAAAEYFESIKHVPAERWPNLIYGAMSDYRARDHHVYGAALMNEMLKHVLSCPEVVAMREALAREHTELEECGAYLVEAGFEEPAHCKRFRESGEALAAFEKLREGK